MRRRNWKRIHATSLPHAIELCVEHAREVHNRSVDQVADLMGLPSKWAIYKWIEAANMPLNRIRPFEFACGCGFITRYLAHSDHKLVIDIPTGRKATARDINQLQGSFTAAVGSLLAFADGKAGADETLHALTTVIEDLAWHRGNVEKHTQPEFDFNQGGTP